jgi:predicted secreted Zn-dependent protease
MAQQDVEPAKHALDATLLSRYAANLPQTMPNLAVSFGLIVLAHLLPVVIRRRWRKFLAAQRRTLA